MLLEIKNKKWEVMNCEVGRSSQRYAKVSKAESHSKGLCQMLQFGRKAWRTLRRLAGGDASNRNSRHLRTSRIDGRGLGSSRSPKALQTTKQSRTCGASTSHAKIGIATLELSSDVLVWDCCLVVNGAAVEEVSAFCMQTPLKNQESQKKWRVKGMLHHKQDFDWKWYCQFTHCLWAWAYSGSY